MESRPRMKASSLSKRGPPGPESSIRQVALSSLSSKAPDLRAMEAGLPSSATLPEASATTERDGLVEKRAPRAYRILKIESSTA
jgi:hypothetical protein